MASAGSGVADSQPQSASGSGGQLAGAGPSIEDLLASAAAGGQLVRARSGEADPVPWTASAGSGVADSQPQTASGSGGRLAGAGPSAEDLLASAPAGGQLVRAKLGEVDPMPWKASASGGWLAGPGSESLVVIRHWHRADCKRTASTGSCRFARMLWRRAEYCWVNLAAVALEEDGPGPHPRVTGVAAVVLPGAPVSAPCGVAAWSESVAVSLSSASGLHCSVGKHNSGWKLTRCPEGELCARRLAATCLVLPASG